MPEEKDYDNTDHAVGGYTEVGAGYTEVGADGEDTSPGVTDPARKTRIAQHRPRGPLNKSGAGSTKEPDDEQTYSSRATADEQTDKQQTLGDNTYDRGDGSSDAKKRSESVSSTGSNSSYVSVNDPADKQEPTPSARRAQDEQFVSLGAASGGEEMEKETSEPPEGYRKVGQKLPDGTRGPGEIVVPEPRPAPTLQPRKHRNELSQWAGDRIAPPTPPGSSGDRPRSR